LIARACCCYSELYLLSPQVVAPVGSCFGQRSLPGMQRESWSWKIDAWFNPRCWVHIEQQPWLSSPVWDMSSLKTSSSGHEWTLRCLPSHLKDISQAISETATACFDV
jgi:hypothetical protein